VLDASGCRHRHTSESLCRPLSLPNLPQMNLAEQHVPGSKNTYYIPDFVTTDEETYLLRKVSWQKSSNHPHLPESRWIHYTQILETPKPKWKQLSNRRYVALWIVVFRASKQEYATGCRHGVTPLADITPIYLTMARAGGDLTAKNVLVAQPLPHFICN